MFKYDISLAPFMGENKSFSVGLNPLGFRTASEQLFAILLPGLNVATLRIRYYSFYCWLLKRFYVHRQNATAAELKKHLRMSELLIALIHAQSNYSDGVPGNTRARKIIARGEYTINFNEDAMPGGIALGGYFKPGYGAFGSYYAASLHQMGLISTLNIGKGLFNVTSQTYNSIISGDALADAFENTVGGKLANVFLECSHNGVVTRQQLSEMESAFQTHYLSQTDECKLLLDLLLQADKPTSEIETTFRKDTLKLLLLYINVAKPEQFSELDFARYVYDGFKNNREKGLASIGWYAYYLNDSRQFEALNIFDMLLKRLLSSKRPGQWEKIDEFSYKLASEIVNEMDVHNDTLNSMFERWSKINEPKEYMAKSFYAIFDNYVKNKAYLRLKHDIKTLFRNISNDVFDYFDNIEDHLEDSVINYVQQYLIEDIIYNHYSESMRKFAQNGILSHKLTIENGYVRGLNTYSATHSSPRIKTLFDFAKDLGLIFNNELTEFGVNLLKQLEK